MTTLLLPGRSRAGSQLDWAHPLVGGLVGAWDFPEGDGAQTRGLTGRATFASGMTWAPSSNGRVLRFPNNATTGIVTIPDAPALNVFTDFTFFARVRREVTGAIQTIYSCSTWSVLLYSNNTIDLLLPGIADNFSTGTVADTLWHDVEVVKQGTAVTFYIDAQPAGTATVTTPSAPSGDKFLGKDISFNVPWNGDMAAVLIWNRPQSPQMVRLASANPYAIYRPADAYVRTTVSAAPAPSVPEFAGSVTLAGASAATATLAGADAATATLAGASTGTATLA